MILSAAGELLQAGLLAPTLAVGLKRIPANRASRCSFGFGQNLWIDGDSHIPIALVGLDRASAQAIVDGSLGRIWRSPWQQAGALYLLFGGHQQRLIEASGPGILISFEFLEVVGLAGLQLVKTKFTQRRQLNHLPLALVHE
ncbi:hypothetical protein PN498_26680 [Oscillatoria sp. CS-180]|uniref:hypothetical protein n=1 Tax=Oscillatoria sp. CS-180 TaxID=3021720 RepID=UPI00232B299F|nr:hypothetical protein [Oscillatoria sp. CS-180]MDB9529605.1 hypothetical protein [Oscillatoria sp. CS-180]